MNWEDGTKDDSSRSNSDWSHDSGISAGSMSSTGSCASQMPTDFSSLRQETFVIGDFDEDEALEQIKDDLTEEERRTAQQLRRPLKNILKAVPRNGRRLGGLRDITNMNTIHEETPKASRVGSMLKWGRKRSMRISFSPEPEDQLKRHCDGKTLHHYPIAEKKPVQLLRAHSTSDMEPLYASTLPPITSPGSGSDNDETSAYTLPAVSRPQKQSTAFRSISGATLVEQVLSLSADEFHAKYILVDCRYPFEYRGGHIKHAVNIHNPAELSTIFYPADEEEFNKMKVRVPIFYCEFSQKRGPTMASTLRELDRERNAWPTLDYGEIYVLDHGYKRFFEDGFTTHCEPSRYTPMLHSDHKDDLKKFTLHKKSKSFSTLRTGTQRVGMRQQMFQSASQGSNNRGVPLVRGATRSENDMQLPRMLRDRMSHLSVESPQRRSPPGQSQSRRRLFFRDDGNSSSGSGSEPTTPKSRGSAAAPPPMPEFC